MKTAFLAIRSVVLCLVFVLALTGPAAADPPAPVGVPVADNAMTEASSAGESTGRAARDGANGKRAEQPVGVPAVETQAAAAGEKTSRATEPLGSPAKSSEKTMTDGAAALLAGSVTVSSVATQDGNGYAKSIFNRNDSIRYAGNVYNSTGASQTAYFAWSVTGPCGSIASWAGNLSTGSGTYNWYLSSSIRSTACGGTYTYKLSVTYGGATSSKSATFTVNTGSGSAYNTAFLTDQQLEDYASMSADSIRSFLTTRNSYFKTSIKDVDGVTFDPATVIAQAASQYRINPKVILTTLQKESSGVTRTTRPSDTNLKFLMGCISPNNARTQLSCAAERFRAYQDQQRNGGSTVSGWKAGVSKKTQDAVTVTPATAAVAGQFTYTPYAGVQWGGNQSSVGGVYLFYDYWRTFGF